METSAGCAMETTSASWPGGNNFNFQLGSLSGKSFEVKLTGHIGFAPKIVRKLSFFFFNEIKIDVHEDDMTLKPMRN